MQKVPFLRRKQAQPPVSAAHEEVLSRVATNTTTNAVEPATSTNSGGRWRRLRRPLSIISTSSLSSSSHTPTFSSSSSSTTITTSTEKSSTPKSSPQRRAVSHSHTQSFSHFNFPPSGAAFNNSAFNRSPSRSASHSHSSSVSSTRSLIVPRRSSSRNYLTGQCSSSSIGSNSITPRPDPPSRQPSIYGKGTINDLASFIDLKEEEQEFDTSFDHWMVDKKEDYFSTVYQDYLTDDSFSSPATPSLESFKEPTYFSSMGVVWVGESEPKQIVDNVPRSCITSSAAAMNHDQNLQIFIDDEDDEISPCTAIRSEW